MGYTSKEHWDDVWTRKKSDKVSWYQEDPNTSIEMILSTNSSSDAEIIDVGGGDSKLVDKLLELDFKNISVLDISEKALERSKQRLGQKANTVKWIECDIREFDSEDKFDIWHDRALLHFLTSEGDVQNYVKLIKKFVKDGGYLIISSFSTLGPIMCSGLDTKQYSEESLKKLFSDGFKHIKSFENAHVTPNKTSQIFIYSIFKKMKS